MKKLLLAASLLVSGLAFSQTAVTRPTVTKVYYDSVKRLVKNSINFDLVNKELIKLINDHRIKNKLSTVTYDSALQKATHLQSEYMSVNNILTHSNTNVNLSSFKKRIETLNGQYNFKSINNIISGGECIARTSVFLSYFDTVSFAKNIFELLKNSAPHNKILLDPDATRIATSVSRLNTEDNLFTCLILA